MVPSRPETTDGDRDEAASKLVDRFSLWSGAAGLIPLPIVDIVAVGGVQLEMLRRLVGHLRRSVCRKSRQIAHCEPGRIGASRQYRYNHRAMGITSALKSIPGIGTAISAFTMPVFFLLAPPM